jgi:hypothetical protein
MEQASTPFDCHWLGEVLSSGPKLCTFHSPSDAPDGFTDHYRQSVELGLCREDDQ